LNKILKQIKSKLKLKKEKNESEIIAVDRWNSWVRI